MPTDMRDWPSALRRNAAICDLGAAIYKARGEAFGGSTELADQSPQVRSEYILRADELLKTLAPRPVSTIVAVRAVDGHDFAPSLARTVPTGDGQ